MNRPNPFRTKCRPLVTGERTFQGHILPKIGANSKNKINKTSRAKKISQHFKLWVGLALAFGTLPALSASATDALEAKERASLRPAKPAHYYAVVCNSMQ